MLFLAEVERAYMIGKRLFLVRVPPSGIPGKYIRVRALCFGSKVSLLHNGGASGFGDKYGLE